MRLRGAMVYPPPAGFDLEDHCRTAGFWGQDRWCRRAETGPCDALRRIDRNLRVGGVMIPGLRSRSGLVRICDKGGWCHDDVETT